MSKYILALIICFMTTSAWAAFPTGWTRSCALTVQKAKVPADQVNFPVLVSYMATAASETNLPDEIMQTGNGNAAQADGGDIRFTSDAAGSLPLNFEIVAFTQDAALANARAEIWVKLPHIYTATDTTFYVWYKAGGAETRPAATDAQWGSRGVWDDGYKGVWHMPDGSSLTVNDSTGQHNGAVTGGVSAAAGQFDGGAAFAGTGVNYISTQTNFPEVVAAFSVSCWVKPGATQVAYADIWGSHTEPYCGFTFQQNNTMLNTYVLYVGNGVSWVNTPVVTLVAGTWQHLVVVKSGTKNIVYINGVNSTEVSDTTSVVPSSINFKFGEGWHDSTRDFNGSIDEGRVSNIARSAQWIATEYNNQSAPETFIVRGTAGAASHPPIFSGGAAITGAASVTY